MPNERSRAANEVAAPDHHHAPAELATIPVFRVLLEVAAVLSRRWRCCDSGIHFRSCGYTTEAISQSFLLIAGLAILLTHRKSLRASWPAEIKAILFASFAAFALHL